LTTPDKQENLRVIEEMVAGAAGEGADVVVLPEFAMYNAPTLGAHTLEAGEPFDGPFVTRLREIASQHGVAVVGGMTQKVPDEERLYNLLVAIDARGETAATYRKLHLFDAFGFVESDFIKPGSVDEEPELFEVGGLRFGMQTCFDVRFPEVSRRIAEAGADVILLPTSWLPGPGKESQLETLVRARAIENVVYVAAADQTPPVGSLAAHVVDPSGAIVAKVGTQPGRVHAVASAETLAALRARMPLLEMRRYAVTVRETAAATSH